MIIIDTFINESFKLMNANKDNCLIIGLRRNEEFNKLSCNNHLESDIDDWRINTHYDHSFFDLRICSNVNQSTDKSKHDFSLLRKTKYFKKLGLSLDKTVDVWDLASVVVGHSILVSKIKYLEVGGFPEFTKGWGCEDMAFGLLCIANGMFIIPNKKIITHIKHAPISGSISNNLIQLRENLERYKTWGKNLNCFTKLDYDMINKRVRNVEVVHGNNI